MFFPERITKIRPTDRVLEIGPGSLPHPRADVYLDKAFSKDEALQQSGHVPPTNLHEKMVYYTGDRFPFEDNSFDYIICSHVIEHVPLNEIALFVSELKRVASRGYIEFPNALYEFMNNQGVHKNLMALNGTTILFLDKAHEEESLNHSLFTIWRELFYLTKQSAMIFPVYKELFFSGFEWEDNIDYNIVTDLAPIIAAMDFNSVDKTIFAIKKTNEHQSFYHSMRSTCKKIVRKLPRLRKNTIHKTAILECRKLIHIDPSAEIKDHVIIRTYRHPVKIGKLSQINPFVVMYGGSGIDIGDYVMIAPHCVLAAGNHRMDDLATPMRLAGSTSSGRPIVIENDVWIGAHCTITDGVRIGRGAVIGANSVVTGDVADYAIMAGCPARKIGSRLEIGKESLCYRK